MLSFLYEQYGYYPQNLINESFIIDNWKFKLIAIDQKNDYVDKIDEFVKLNRKIFDNIGPYIIPTRNGEKVASYDGKKYVLVSVYLRDISVEDVRRFHYVFAENDRNVDLKTI